MKAILPSLAKPAATTVMFCSWMPMLKKRLRRSGSVVLPSGLKK